MSSNTTAETTDKSAVGPRTKLARKVCANWQLPNLEVMSWTK